MYGKIISRGNDDGLYWLILEQDSFAVASDRKSETQGHFEVRY